MACLMHTSFEHLKFELHESEIIWEVTSNKNKDRKRAIFCLMIAPRQETTGGEVLHSLKLCWMMKKEIKVKANIV